MPNEVQLGLDTSQAEAKLDRLEQKAERLRALIANAGEGGGGGGTGAGTAAQAGQTGGTAVLTGSVQGAPPIGATAGTEAAAVAVSKTQMGQWKATMARYPGLGVAAQQAIAAEMGLPGVPTGIAPLPQTPNAATATIGLVQSAQATQVLQATALAQRTAMGGVLPVGYQSNGPWATGQLAQGGGLDPTMALTTAQLAAARGQSPFGAAPAGVGFGAFAAAAVPAYHALGVSTQERATGRPDLMGRAAIPGMVLGAAAGFFLGGPLGAGAGAMLGGQVSQWLAAPLINEQMRKEALYGMAGFFGSDLAAGSKWAGDVNNWITRNGSSWQTMSGQAVAAMGSHAAFGIWMGGGDPFRQVGYDAGNGPIGPMPPIPGYQGSRRGPVNPIYNLGIQGIRQAQWSRDMQRWRGTAVAPSGEALWQSVTANIAGLYPNEDTAQAVMNRITPIFGARPETGDNIVDILARFGPQAAYEYGQALAPGYWVTRTTGGSEPPGSVRRDRMVGLPRWDRDTLRDLSVTMRASERGLAMAGTLARGGPAMSVGILDREMGAMADLPGGRDSLAYREAGVARRHAVQSAFSEYAGATFELPLARMGGMLERASMMPFAPGYTFGMGLQAASYRAQYVGAISQYRAVRRRRGELSVEEDLSLENQTQALLSANQEVLAQMSEGGPNLMASLSTGAPAGFRRYDAIQMAALRVRGTPIRRWGAMGGAQAGAQEGFLRGFGFGGLGPMSPTAALDPNSGAVVGLLREILNEMRRGGGSFPMRARGAADLAPSGGYTQSGNGVPWG